MKSIVVSKKFVVKPKFGAIVTDQTKYIIVVFFNIDKTFDVEQYILVDLGMVAKKFIAEMNAWRYGCIFRIKLFRDIVKTLCKAFDAINTNGKSGIILVVVFFFKFIFR